MKARPPSPALASARPTSAVTPPRRLALALLLGACGAPEAPALLLQPVLPDCPRQPASVVRVNLLGDFPPISVSGAATPLADPLGVALQGARSLSVEGLSARSTVALAFSGPLLSGGATSPPALVPRGASQRGGVVPLVYGAPDSLCTAWSLLLQRGLHRATLLDATDTEAAAVMISGGVVPDGPSDTLEIYRLDAPLMPRALPLYEGAAIGHSATALTDGTVLVAGGAKPHAMEDPARETARLYRHDGQPASGVLFLSGGPRALHAALRRGGDAYLLGGCSVVEPLPWPLGLPATCSAGAILNTVVRYDSQGNFTEQRALATPRYGHSALLLPDGRILLHGGMTVVSGKVVPALSGEVYDPQAPSVSYSRVGGAALALPVGGVLWSDIQSGNPAAGGLVYSANEARPLPPQHERTGATLSPLLDGGALLAGGVDSFGAAVSPLEVFSFGRFRDAAGPGTPRWPVIGHAALPLPDGTVLLTGGLRYEGGPPRLSNLVGRFIHALRVPDATPPAWPLDAAEGQGWLAPRRFERVSFDGAVLRLMGGALPAGVDRTSPEDRALLAGPILGAGRLDAGLALESGVGAALVLAHRSERDYAFIRLVPGMPVGLWQMKGAQAVPVSGCQGELLSISPLGTAEQPVPLSLSFGAQGLRVSLAEREFLRCAWPQGTPGADPNGAVGFGTLGGGVTFSDLVLRRGG